MHALPRLVCWWSGAVILLGSAHAETTRPPATGTDGKSTGVTLVPGIFTTELPDLLNAANLRLSLRPHFGDLIDHDNLRLTIGARYGLTERLELTGETDAYFAHGLNNASFGENLGLSRVQFGAKYQFEDWLQPYWKTAAGLKYSFPVSRPPREFTSEFRVLTPFLTLAHTWETRPEFTSFVGFGVNFVDRARPRGTSSGDYFGEHNWFIKPGMLWNHGAITYTFETTVASTLGFADDDQYQVTLRPGLEWTLPPEFKFHAKNRWVIGVALSVGAGDLGSDLGAKVRIQTDFDFKRFLSKKATAWAAR